jgi:hypothetical protein
MRPLPPASRHLAGALVVVTAVCYRFGRTTFHGVFAMGDDTLNQYYPLVAGLWSRLREGDLPLWSPEILLGYPALGSVDAHAFSPFHWPFLAFEPPVAVALACLSIALTSALLMYALGQQLGLGAAGAAAAAVLWSTGRPTVYMLIEPMASATAGWFPLVLLLWHRSRSGGGLPWAVAAGTALGLALLGGHAQHVYWFSLFLAAYTLVLLPAGTDLRGALGSSGRAVGAGSAMAVVALAVGAVVVLPTWELLQESHRPTLVGADRIAETAPSVSRALEALPQILLHAAPPVEDMEYPRAGIVAVALALLALGRGRTFENRLGALALCFLALSFAGVFPPTAAIVEVMPGNDFRYPQRIGLVFTLATAILAGFGMRRLVAGVGGLGRVTLLALACLVPTVSLLGSGSAAARAEGLFYLLALALVVGAVGLPRWLRRPSRLGAALAALAVAVFVHHSRVMADALMVDVGALGSVLAGERPGLYGGVEGRGAPWPPRVLDDVPTRDAFGPTRMICVGCPWPRWDSVALLTGHQTPSGYVSLRPARVERLVYGRRGIRDPDSLLTSPALLDMMGVRYRLSPTDDGVSVVTSPGALPRSYFVGRARRAESAEDALARVTAPGFDPRLEVVLEGDVALSDSPDEGTAPFTPARVTRYGAERVEVEVDAPAPGWLVLLDRHARGWSARVDGEPVPIAVANYLFRAMPVAAGPSRVTFEYESPALRWGGALSLAGLAVGALGALRCLRAAT